MRKGFTLVEALVSIVLLAVGIASASSALAALARGEARARDASKYYALAQSKYDELTIDATGQGGPTGGAQGDQSGDFADQGEPDVEWTFTVAPSGIENLDALSLTVTRRGSDTAPRAVLSSLRYTPPLTAGTAQ